MERVKDTARVSGNGSWAIREAVDGQYANRRDRATEVPVASSGGIEVDDRRSICQSCAKLFAVEVKSRVGRDEADLERGVLSVHVKYKAIMNHAMRHECRGCVAAHCRMPSTSRACALFAHDHHIAHVRARKTGQGVQDCPTRFEIKLPRATSPDAVHFQRIAVDRDAAIFSSGLRTKSLSESSRLSRLGGRSVKIHPPTANGLCDSAPALFRMITAQACELGPQRCSMYSGSITLRMFPVRRVVLRIAPGAPLKRTITGWTQDAPKIAEARYSTSRYGRRLSNARHGFSCGRTRGIRRCPCGREDRFCRMGSHCLGQGRTSPRARLPVFASTLNRNASRSTQGSGAVLGGARLDSRFGVDRFQRLHELVSVRNDSPFVNDLHAVPRGRCRPRSIDKPCSMTMTSPCRTRTKRGTVRSERRSS